MGNHTHPKKLEIFILVSLVILVVISAGCISFGEEVIQISEIKEDPKKFDVVTVEGKFKGRIMQPKCYPYYSAPTEWIIEDSSGNIEVDGEVPNIKVGSRIRLKGKVKAYNGPVGCGKVLKDDTKVKPKNQTIIYLQAIEWEEKKVNQSSLNETPELENFSVVDSGCTGSQENKVTVEIRDKIVQVVGKITEPNPCYKLNADLRLESEKKLLLDINSERQEVMCVECLGYIEYKASLSNAQTFSGYTLEVRHDNEIIKTTSLS